MSERHGLEQLNRIPVAEAVVRNAIPAMIAMLMTVGTKIPLTLSAKRATGALVEVASSTNLIIWAKAVSPPTFVARISI